jgi:hypothetical protein
MKHGAYEGQQGGGFRKPVGPESSTTASRVRKPNCLGFLGLLAEPGLASKQSFP